jgi:hypothetical protein
VRKSHPGTTSFQGTVKRHVGKAVAVGLLLGFISIWAFVVGASPLSFEDASRNCGLQARFNVEVGQNFLEYKPLLVESGSFEAVECLMNSYSFSEEDVRAVHNVYLQFISGEADGVWQSFQSGEVKLVFQAHSLNDFYRASFSRP